jgi:L-alanine-DL-glutamate epimerase-like enolase superfamily enzyme
VAPPNVVKILVENDYADTSGWDGGIRWLLRGEDPSDPLRLWLRLKSRTFWSCRAGIGHCALAGVDTALWDLAGKLAGVPSWQLMGKLRPDPLVPYVTVYHGIADFRATFHITMETLDQALDAGFRAFKVEATTSNVPNLLDAVELTSKAREKVGPDFPLLLDLGYRLRDFDEGKELVSAVNDLDLYALEAPYHPDRLDDYARLRDAVDMPIATGDQLTAACEYFPLLAAGTVDIIQAGAARTGVSDMLTLAAEAATRGKELVPWGWIPSAIGATANLHLAAVTPNVPLVEYRPSALYPDALIRRALALPEPQVAGGRFVTPTAPGLGLEVDWELVERLRLP